MLAVATSPTAYRPGQGILAILYPNLAKVLVTIVNNNLIVFVICQAIEEVETMTAIFPGAPYLQASTSPAFPIPTAAWCILTNV